MKVNIKAGQIGQVVSAETAYVNSPPGKQEPAVSPSADPPPRNEASPRATSTGAAGSVERRHVFMSYSHADTAWVQKLEKVLAPLLRSREVTVWWDRDIRPSEKWKEEIDAALAGARVALLLVSPSFLGSEFIMDHELPCLLEAAQRKEVRLLWVLLQNCLYKRTPLNDYQAAHDVSRPLNALSEPELDNVLVCVAEALAAAMAN